MKQPIAAPKLRMSASTFKLGMSTCNLGCGTVGGIAPRGTTRSIFISVLCAEAKRFEGPFYPVFFIKLLLVTDKSLDPVAIGLELQVAKAPPRNLNNACSQKKEASVSSNSRQIDPSMEGQSPTKCLCHIDIIHIIYSIIRYIRFR